MRFLIVGGHALAAHGRPRFTEDLDVFSGVSLREAWRGRIDVALDGLTVGSLGEAALRKNKLASGRPKDLADLALLDEGKGAR